MADESAARTVADLLIIELERLLDTARSQQALLRSSLGRVIEQLDPPSGG